MILNISVDEQDRYIQGGRRETQIILSSRRFSTTLGPGTVVRFKLADLMVSKPKVRWIALPSDVRVRIHSTHHSGPPATDPRSCVVGGRRAVLLVAARSPALFTLRMLNPVANVTHFTGSPYVT